MGAGFKFLGCTWADEKGDRFYTESCEDCGAETTIPLAHGETHDQAKEAIKLGHGFACKEGNQN